MVSVDDAFQVELKIQGEKFQVLVDFDKLNEFKKNTENVSVYDVLADTKIFRDQKKGELASENHLNAVFEGKSEEDILKIILLKGDCQIPTAYLNKLRDEKKVQVVNYIVENAINGQTKGKFTPTMVSDEVDKLKFNFDYNKSFESQAEEVVELLKKVMPIRISRIIMEINVPGQHCGAFYGPFRKYGKITKEYFDDDGNLHLHIEIAETKIDEVVNYIKNNSNGEGEYFVSKP